MKEFEEMADAFHTATGYMAPGKDVPPEMGYTREQDAERHRLWRSFVAGYYGLSTEAPDA